MYVLNSTQLNVAQRFNSDFLRLVSSALAPPLYLSHSRSYHVPVSAFTNTSPPMKIHQPSGAMVASASKSTINTTLLVPHTAALLRNRPLSIDTRVHTPHLQSPLHAMQRLRFSSTPYTQQRYEDEVEALSKRSAKARSDRQQRYDDEVEILKKRLAKVQIDKKNNDIAAAKALHEAGLTAVGAHWVMRFRYILGFAMLIGSLGLIGTVLWLFKKFIWRTMGWGHDEYEQKERDAGVEDELKKRLTEYERTERIERV